MAQIEVYLVNTQNDEYDGKRGQLIAKFDTPEKAHAFIVEHAKGPIQLEDQVCWRGRTGRFFVAGHEYPAYFGIGVYFLCESEAEKIPAEGDPFPAFRTRLAGQVPDYFFEWFSPTGFDSRYSDKLASLETIIRICQNNDTPAVLGVLRATIADLLTYSEHLEIQVGRYNGSIRLPEEAETDPAEIIEVLVSRHPHAPTVDKLIGEMKLWASHEQDSLTDGNWLVRVEEASRRLRLIIMGRR